MACQEETQRIIPSAPVLSSSELSTMLPEVPVSTPWEENVTIPHDINSPHIVEVSTESAVPETNIGVDHLCRPDETSQSNVGIDTPSCPTPMSPPPRYSENFQVLVPEEKMQHPSVESALNGSQPVERMYPDLSEMDPVPPSSAECTSGLSAGIMEPPVYTQLSDAAHYEIPPPLFVSSVEAARPHEPSVDTQSSHAAPSGIHSLQVVSAVEAVGPHEPSVDTQWPHAAPSGIHSPQIISSVEAVHSLGTLVVAHAVEDVGAASAEVNAAADESLQARELTMQQQKLALDRQMHDVRERNLLTEQRRKASKLRIVSAALQGGEDLLSGTALGTNLFGRRGTQPLANGPPRKLEEWVMTEQSNGFSVMAAGKRLPLCASATAAIEQAKALTPVVWQHNDTCVLCGVNFALLKRRHHCRNCGHSVCDSCSPARWDTWALPSRYARSKVKFSHRVCISCDNLSQEFRTALAEGNAARVYALYETGNLNLRTPFPQATARKLPLHLAAQSGSVELLHWLVITKRVAVHVTTKQGETPLKFAADAMQVQAMSWLVVVGCSSVTEIVDHQVMLRALNAVLRDDALVGCYPAFNLASQQGVVMADASFAREATLAIAEDIYDEERDSDF